MLHGSHILRVAAIVPSSKDEERCRLDLKYRHRVQLHENSNEGLDTIWVSHHSYDPRDLCCSLQMYVTHAIHSEELAERLEHLVKEGQSYSYHV